MVEDIGRYSQILRTSCPWLAPSSLEFFGGGSFRVSWVDNAFFVRLPRSHGTVPPWLHQPVIYDNLHRLIPLVSPSHEFVQEGCVLFNRSVAGYPKLGRSCFESLLATGSRYRPSRFRLAVSSQLPSVPQQAVQPAAIAMVTA